MKLDLLRRPRHWDVIYLVAKQLGSILVMNENYVFDPARIGIVIFCAILGY